MQISKVHAQMKHHEELPDRKIGKNKGVARRWREQKNWDAEARNEKTLPENRRQYRLKERAA